MRYKTAFLVQVVGIPTHAVPGVFKVTVHSGGAARQWLPQNSYREIPTIASSVSIFANVHSRTTMPIATAIAVAHLSCEY
eukprot:3681897-Rhodomonas_salina.1